MAQLSVNLVTPERELVRTNVDQVTAPSVMGEVGILPDHLPLLASIDVGPVGLFHGGQVNWYAVTDGFVEVHGNHVTILAETAERADEINIKRCRNTLEDAIKQLEKLDYGTHEYDEQESRRVRAENRIAVTEMGSK